VGVVIVAAERAAGGSAPPKDGQEEEAYAPKAGLWVAGLAATLALVFAGLWLTGRNRRA
jgi:hypothetical protein